MTKKKENDYFIEVSDGPNEITVVGIIHGMRGYKHKVLSIGVSRCGAGQEYSPVEGARIALNRAKIQPWNRIALEDKAAVIAAEFVFRTINESIVDHLRRTRGSWAANLTRERTKVSLPTVR